MRPLPTAIVVYLATACNGVNSSTTAEIARGKSPSNPTTAPTYTGPAPTWKEGETWTVHYKYKITNYTSVHPRPMHQESTWTYLVTHVDILKQFHINATERDTGYTWKLLFNKTGNLTAIYPPHDRPPLPMSEGPMVILAADSGMRFTPSWPKFPLEPGETTFDDGAVTQHASLENGAWIVTLIRTGEYDRQARTTTVVQRWDPALPWWSTAAVDKKTTYKGVTYEERDLDGWLESWGTTSSNREPEHE